MCSKRLKLWNTMPIFRRKWCSGYPLAVMFSPSTQISPEVGGSSMLMALRRVLLPVPEGPMILMTSPF